MDGDSMKKGNKTVTFLKQKSYLLASILMLVAVFGMTGMYISEQRSEKKQQAKLEQEQKEQEELAKQQEQEQKEQETAAVDQVIRPENDDFLDAPEVVTSKEEQPAKEPEQPAAEAANETENQESEENSKESKKQQPAKETSAVSQVPELHFDAAQMGWPLQGAVLMDYNVEQTVYFKTMDHYKYNPAIIISGNVNDKVLSVADGIVSNIETNEVTGCVVTVDLGDGYSAVYGQLKEVSLHAGDFVEAGSTIGYVSEPTKYFSLEGPNLYFQMIKDNESIDPMEFLQIEE